MAPSNLTTTTRVKVTTKAGTAKAGSDFTPLTSTVTFYKGGLKEKTVTLVTKSDSVQEQAETLSLSLSVNNKVVSTVSVTVNERGAGASTTPTVGQSAPANCANRPPRIEWNNGFKDFNTSRVVDIRPWIQWKNNYNVANPPPRGLFPGLAGEWFGGRREEGKFVPEADIPDGTVVSFGFIAPTVAEQLRDYENRSLFFGIDFSNVPEDLKTRRLGAIAALNFFDGQSNGTDTRGTGYITTSISECPGEILQYNLGQSPQGNFVQRLAGEPNYKEPDYNNCWGGKGEQTSVRWYIDDVNTPPLTDPAAIKQKNSSCILVPGRKYYYNISTVEGCRIPTLVDNVTLPGGLCPYHAFVDIIPFK